MATRFPATGIDDGTTLPNPAATDKRNSPSHAGLHDNTNDAIKATQTKLGTGSSTPTANTFLFGTGTGTSAWSQITSAQLIASVTDETGTGSLVFGTTPTLITPKVDTINEATLNNGVTVAGVNIKSGVIQGTPLAASSVTTANLQTGAVTGSKISSYGYSTQAITTNSAQTALIIQEGWNYVTAASGTTTTKAITLPTSLTTVVQIQAGWIGATTTTPTVVTNFTTAIGGENIQNSMTAISTSGFTFNAYKSTAFTSSAFYGFWWRVVGI